MRALALLFLMVSNIMGQEYIQVDRISFIQNGKRFFSVGVNCIKIADDPGQIVGDPYYNEVSQGENKWAAEVKSRFDQWGFNTVGPFSSEFLSCDFLYTHSIYFGNYDKNASHMLCDVFSEEYEKIIDQYAKQECEKHKDNKNLIGYFISNELKIFGDLPWKPHRNSLLDIYLRLPSDSPGHRKVVDFIRKTEGMDSNKQKDVWVGIVLTQYMKICSQAIKRYDQNHLILGTRFAAIPPDEAVLAVAEYSDVLSFNLYNNDFSLVDRWHSLTGKPIMITEFSWRAVENKTGNKNVHGPDVTVNTDKDRAHNYTEYLNKIINRPFCIGIQWFQYFDEPASGRGNDGYGEDGAYGIVSVKNEIYEELALAMSKMNKLWQSQLSK
jgi:hypothetical protein